MIVKGAEGEEWMLSVVYASPNPSIRRHLWEYLFHIDNSIKFPWLVVGDLTAMVHLAENNGGRSIGRASQSGLKEIL